MRGRNGSKLSTTVTPLPRYRVTVRQQRINQVAADEAGATRHEGLLLVRLKRARAVMAMSSPAHQAAALSGANARRQGARHAHLLILRGCGPPRRLHVDVRRGT